MIEIITYQEKYKADFIRLNTEWIETWFWLEESDRKTFATVDSYIIGNGGPIIYCCALLAWFFRTKNPQTEILIKTSVNPVREQNGIRRTFAPEK